MKLLDEKMKLLEQKIVFWRRPTFIAKFQSLERHIWPRYGMVRTSYGIDMVPSFVKCQAMGSIWD